MTARIAGAALALSLVLAAPAGAQEPVASPTPAPTATPAPVPAPAPATLKLRADGAIRDGARRLVLRGETVRFSGRLLPRPADAEHVIVRVFRGAQQVGSRRIPVRADGTFLMRHRAGRTGGLRARAFHPRSEALRSARSPATRVQVVVGEASFGDRGPLVRRLQWSLRQMRYAVPRSGVYDAATDRAVMAYRKVNRLPRISSAPASVYRRIAAGRGAYVVRHPREPRHLEADLSRQVLALVGPRGRLERVYTTSSGAPATPTVTGRFKVYRRDIGTNSLGMVHAAYFIGGYAVHGYVSVPPYNASHGCLRVPVPDAWSIREWLTMGTVVIVDRG